MSIASPAQRLKELGVVAMLGTDRARSSEKPQTLLAQAAILGAQARAGFKPGRHVGRMPPCPADALPPAGASLMATLIRLLGESDAGLITEWAELASAKGVRVDDSSVPIVLEWWSRQTNRPEVVFRVLGKRGEWLSRLNPAWQKSVAGSAIPANVEELWQTGKAPVRVSLLHTVRRHDPASAVKLLELTWQSDGAEERRQFVDALRDRCSMADEAFLEATLDDKSRLVRRAAAAMLALLPGSRLKARMNERARGMIVIERTRGLLKRGVKVLLSPPKDFDSAWERDGIEAKATGGTGPRAWWMRQILGAADLSVWSDAIGLGPDGVLESISKDDHFAESLTAISEAAARAGDEAWIAAILRYRLQEKKLNVHELQGLWQNLPPAEREPLVLTTAEQASLSTSERWWVLASTQSRWSGSFSRAALKLLSKHKAHSNDAWGFYESVDRISRCIAPECAEQLAELVSGLFAQEPTKSFEKSIHRVHFRANMHEEFAA